MNISSTLLWMLIMLMLMLMQHFTFTKTNVWFPADRLLLLWVWETVSRTFTIMKLCLWCVFEGTNGSRRRTDTSLVIRMSALPLVLASPPPLRSLLLILDFSKFSVPHISTLLPFSFITTSLTSLPHFLPIPPSIFPLHLFISLLSFPFLTLLPSSFLSIIFPAPFSPFLAFYLSLPLLFPFLSFPFLSFPLLLSSPLLPPSFLLLAVFFFFRSEFACRFRVFSSMSRPCYQTWLPLL